MKILFTVSALFLSLNSMAMAEFECINDAQCPLFYTCEISDLGSSCVSQSSCGASGSGCSSDTDCCSYGCSSGTCQ